MVNFKEAYIHLAQGKTIYRHLENSINDLPLILQMDNKKIFYLKFYYGPGDPHWETYNLTEEDKMSKEWIIENFESPLII